MSAGGLSYDCLTSSRKATLPSVEMWSTNMNILRDPPKSVFTRKITRVGDTQQVLLAQEDSGDRMAEYINVYARGVNPMVSVSYDNYGNNGGQRPNTIGKQTGVRLPYRPEVFRPPVLRQEDLMPLSRQPREWFYALTNPEVPNIVQEMKCPDAKSSVHRKGSRRYDGMTPDPTIQYNVEKPVEVSQQGAIHPETRQKSVVVNCNRNDVDRVEAIHAFNPKNIHRNKQVYKNVATSIRGNNKKYHDMTTTTPPRRSIREKTLPKYHYTPNPSYQPSNHHVFGTSSSAVHASVTPISAMTSFQSRYTKEDMDHDTTSIGIHETITHPEIPVRPRQSTQEKTLLHDTIGREPRRNLPIVHSEIMEPFYAKPTEYHQSTDITSSGYLHAKPLHGDYHTNIDSVHRSSNNVREEMSSYGATRENVLRTSLQIQPQRDQTTLQDTLYSDTYMHPQDRNLPVMSAETNGSQLIPSDRSAYESVQGIDHHRIANHSAFIGSFDESRGQNMIPEFIHHDDEETSHLINHRGAQLREAVSRQMNDRFPS